MRDCAELAVKLALLTPQTGTWIAGHGIAGAAVIAVDKVNADEALLPRRLSGPVHDRRCGKGYNTKYLKVLA